MSKKWETAAIHWEIHGKKGNQCSISLKTKNAGSVRDEGPAIWADDIKLRMVCYFTVSLAIREFSNVLKESRY